MIGGWLSGLVILLFPLAESYLGSIRLHKSIPVSYTHLDVYKRQAWNTRVGTVSFDEADRFR